MIKARPKYPTDLHGTIYIDNISAIIKFSITKIPGCMTYVVHPVKCA